MGLLEVVAILAFVAGIYGQHTQKVAAEDLNEAQIKQFDARRKAAEDAFRKEVFAVRSAEIEQQAEVAAQAEQIVRQGLQVRGVALASSGSANVGGQAVSDVINEFSRQEIGTLSRLNLFQKFRSGQIEQAIRNAATTQDLRVLSFLPGPAVQPQVGVGEILSIGGTSLQIAAAADNLFGNEPATVDPTGGQS